jgi:integrase
MSSRTTRRRPFGFVRYREGRNKPYLAGFNPPGGGREITKAFAGEEEADLWLAEHHVHVGRGSFVSPAGAKTLLGDYWKIRMAEGHLRPSSAETYQRRYDRYIGPKFGHREIGSLRRGEIQAWANHLPVAPRTAANILGILQSVLKAATNIDELVPRSVAIGVKAPPAARRQLVVPTAEEVYAIADAMNGRYVVAVRLGAEAGLRLGEILGIRVEDLDLLRHRLTVSRQAQTIDGRGVVLDLPPKSEAGYRRIPLAPETVEAVARHLGAYGSTGGLVVTTASGMPVRRQHFDQMWIKAKARAGMEHRELRFHDLRHRYASVLIESGLDALTVKTLLGHSSIEETFGTYGHMFPNQEERAALAISEAISGLSRTGPRTKAGITAGQRA